MYGLPLVLGAGILLGFGMFQPAVFFQLGGAVVLVAGLFVLNFFRDPERIIPSSAGAIVAPADGTVVEVKEADFSGEPVQQVSIFMSPLNVHINRAPIAGVITRINYRKGSYHVAWDARASVENEQNVFTVEGPQGKVVVKQIAGVLARRVVFWKREGERLEKGERVGMIKFGSRVDLLVSPGVKLQVKTGDRVRGGSSIIGISPEPAS